MIVIICICIEIHEGIRQRRDVSFCTASRNRIVAYSTASFTNAKRCLKLQLAMVRWSCDCFLLMTVFFLVFFNSACSICLCFPLFSFFLYFKEIGSTQLSETKMSTMLIAYDLWKLKLNLIRNEHNFQLIFFRNKIYFCKQY